MAEDTIETRDELEDILDEATAAGDEADADAGAGDSDPVSEPIGGRQREALAPTYDFRRPYNISRQFEKSMMTVSEGFSKSFSIEFTSLLRSNVTAQSKGLRLSTFGDFVKSLPELSCIGTLTLSPLTGQTLVQMDLGLAFIMLKRLLGGPIDQEKRVRKFTDIEISLTDIIMEKVMSCLKDCTAKMINMEPRYVALENKPDYLGTMSSGEPLIIMPLEIDAEGIAGEICICIPLSAFESVWHIFDPEEVQEYRTPEEIAKDQGRMYKNVLATSAEVVVQLGEIDLKLREIRNLKVGDVLPLQKSINSPLLLEIQGRPMFRGMTGKLNQNRALKLTERLTQED